MGNPYWIYETMAGDNQCVSIRQSDYNLNFYIFLGKFIEAHANRILIISEPSALYDGSIVCVVRLKGREGVEYQGKDNY